MNDSPLDVVSALPDDELVGRLTLLACRERETSVELIAHLAELDARKLYLGLGYGSLFSYCTSALRLAEHAAYNRIEAARVSRRLPGILERLADGSLNLSSLRLLAPHLTPGNCDEVLDEASGRSKREVEAIVARLAPSADVPASVRKLPARRIPAAGEVAIGTRPLESGPRASRDVCRDGTVVAGDTPAATSARDEVRLLDSPAVGQPAPTKRSDVAPLSPARYRLQCTVDQATHDQLRLLQDLLRREIPDGDPGRIVARALKLLLDDVMRQKTAAAARGAGKRGTERGTAPATGSRYVPAHVRRGVWLRDGGQCAFVSRQGRRCRERAFLELHHVEPYAIGGETTLANLSLRCRAHDAHEARLVFGARRFTPPKTEAGTAVSSSIRDDRTRPGASRGASTRGGAGWSQERLSRALEPLRAMELPRS